MPPKRPIFDRWCEVTNCHGVADYHRGASVTAKTVWAVLLAISFVMMISNLSATFNTFFDSQRRWGTTVYQSPNGLEGLEFPIITICNYNRVKKSLAERFGMDEELILMLFNSFSAVKYFMEIPPGVTIRDDKDPSEASMKRIKERIKAAREKFKNWKLKYNFNMSSILRTLGHKCSDMVVKIWSYNGESIWADDTCKADVNASVSVTQVITSEFGLCHQFNVTGLMKRVTMQGAAQALHMVLDIESSEYLPYYRFNYMREGLAIQLSYDGQVNVGGWIAVAPGFYTQMGMKQRLRTTTNTQIFTVDMFTPPCSNSYVNKYRPPNQYSKSLCENECIIEAGYNQCHCLELVEAEGYRMCEVEDMITCVVKALREGNDSGGNVFQQSKECRRQCLDGCTSRTVDVSTSMTQFMTAAQTAAMKKDFRGAGVNASDEAFQNLIMLDFFYSTMEVEVVEMYVKTTLDQLISNIGGQMGIWAGISVLTLCQAIIYLGQAVTAFGKRFSNSDTSQHHRDRH